HEIAPGGIHSSENEARNHRARDRTRPADRYDHKERDHIAERIVRLDRQELDADHSAKSATSDGKSEADGVDNLCQYAERIGHGRIVDSRPQLDAESRFLDQEPEPSRDDQAAGHYEEPVCRDGTETHIDGPCKAFRKGNGF